MRYRALSKRKFIDSDYPICGNCVNCVSRANNYHYCKRRKALHKNSNRYGEGRVYKNDRACYYYEPFEETSVELSEEERELIKKSMRRGTKARNDER